jgi:hypothetical protein
MEGELAVAGILKNQQVPVLAREIRGDPKPLITRRSEVQILSPLPIKTGA